MYIRIWYFKRYLCLTEITIRQLEFSFHWKQCPLNVGKKNMCDFYVPKIENSLIWRKKTHSSWLFYYYEEKKSRIKKSRNQIMQWTPTSFFMFDTFVPYKPKARSRLCRLCSWRISSIRRTRSLEHSSCVTAKIRVKNLRWLYFLEFPVTSVTFTL